MTFRAAVAGALLLLVPCACGWAQSASDKAQQIQEHMRQAQRDIAGNQAAQAILEYRAVLALDPDSVDAHANLGVLLFTQGNYEEASSHLRAALKLKPDLWKTQAMLGMSEKRSGDLAQAQADLESAFRNLDEPKIRVQVGMELIEANYAMDDLDRAASVVGVLRGVAPTNPQVLYTAYRIYAELTNETMLSMGLVAPKSAQMHLIMAHEMARQNDGPGAIEQYREALRLDSNIPGVHYELAESLHNSSDPVLQASAEAEYKAAIAANRFDEKAVSRLGEIAAKNGDMKQAYAYYTKAVTLQPNDVEANVGLARVLTTMNEKEKALSVLEHAVQVDPTNSIVHYRLSMLYRQAGKSDEAKREMEKFQQYKALRSELNKVFVEMRVHAIEHSAEEGDEPPQ